MGLKTPMKDNNLLTMHDVTKKFGGLVAIDDVTMSIQRGQIHGLIGPNGAGKTTLFNLMTGLYQPDRGQFNFNNKSLLRHTPNEIAKIGIARTFQNIRLFTSMTVLENVLVGMHCRLSQNVLSALFKTKHQQEEENHIRTKAYEILDYVGISRFANKIASHLSYGDQRRLEISRALATNPSLLALDEPAAGMNATEKQKLRELLLRLKQDHKTVLLIEHDVKLIMGICDEVTVLDYGKIIEQGSPAVIQKSPAVIEAYLGSLHHVE